MIQIDLSGKRAVVGGSSRGLGLASAQQLASAGAEVIMMARNEEKLQRAIQTLSTHAGQKHRYLLVDYANPQEFEARVKEYFSGLEIHILVNNTNGPAPGTVMEKGVADFQQAFDLLFKSYVTLTQVLLPGMVKSGYGRVINVSSSSVKEPIPNLVLSNSIRSAVSSWAKSLSREVAGAGVTVNTILTGSFDTERIKEVIAGQAERVGKAPEQLLEEKRQAIPAGRLGKPEEYGFLVTFLASPLAAYINGTSIPIDGGNMTAV
ncbi:3-oxoacyl-[acyl-carrier protein] reductase [Lunatimonas lonarensis]|uniref:3-oxoacyl-[acyl-carrier protein] reductase n=1 Tax=Lunatimonas lonarensis TaxID=1232681 RepID=R7ZZ84_9BACT|nr:SDR family oxidoreductase [Lunatimonas lonarensis]EON79401.1 3-oxoacyl-[acyl-carrier protein] reductase [Lunatimonas lonarensis]